MNKMINKRLLSVLLCLMLVIGIMPITVSAADYEFTIQPQGGILADGQTQFEVSWQTNFTPVKLQILSKMGDAYATFYDPTSTSETFDWAIDRRIRAYYDPTHYIDSDAFSVIDRTKVKYDLQPKSCTIAAGKSTAYVSWATNFSPVKLHVINAYGVAYKGYENPLTSHDYFGPVENNRIRAYYGKGSADYI